MAKGTWELYFDAMREQDWEGARKSLLSLLQTEKNKPQLYLKIGDVDQRLGLVDNAVEAYHRAAGLLHADGFLQKAAAVCKIILRLDPEDAGAIELSGRIIDELDAAAKTKPRFSATARPKPAEQAPAEETIPDVFAGTPEAVARDFLRSLAVRSFADGEAVVSEGDSGHSMYIIRSGSARVVTHLLGREIALGTLAAHDLFGEVSFLSGRERTASVIAVGPLTAYVLGKAELEKIISLNAAIISNLEELWQSRAHETISRVKQGP